MLSQWLPIGPNHLLSLSTTRLIPRPLPLTYDRDHIPPQASAHLTNLQVRIIRWAYIYGLPTSDLSTIFNTSLYNIHVITSGASRYDLLGHTSFTPTPVIISITRRSPRIAVRYRLDGRNRWAGHRSLIAECKKKLRVGASPLDPPCQ